MIFNDRVDFVAFSGHKFHAPRGTGFIYGRRGRRIAPLMNGGGQEKNQRSGTENLPGIAAMAKAVRLVLEKEPAAIKVERQIKQLIIDHISRFDKVVIFFQRMMRPLLPTFCVLQSRESAAKQSCMRLRSTIFLSQRRVPVRRRVMMNPAL